MDTNEARKIITYVVENTKWRWKQFDVSWQDIDHVFVERGFEQQGFHMAKFVPLLEERGIFAIESIGSILSKAPVQSKKYVRDYAGCKEAPFYMELKNGERGAEGERFYDAVSVFLNNRIGSKGRFFWRMLWFALVSCHYLQTNFDGSFARFLLTDYARFCGKDQVSNGEFLSMDSERWEEFLENRKPWKRLLGIGDSVFDYIVGDVKEASFFKNSYKFDSANQHFFKVTGISKLIEPFDRSGTIQFLNRIEIPFALREINKGIYTYCSASDYESNDFGFCRSLSKCQECGVTELCRKLI